MPTKSSLVNTSIRMNPDTKQYFEQSFEASGTNSKGEFIAMLLDVHNNGEPGLEPRTIEKIVHVEKIPGNDELILKLSPAQMFALRETVLQARFAESQNEVIESLQRENRPYLYFGNLFEPEFQTLWMKNKVFTKEMSPSEKEAVIRFNMVAFLVNMFLTQIIEGKMSESAVTAETLKMYIRRQTAQAAVAKLPIISPLKNKLDDTICIES